METLNWILLLPKFRSNPFTDYSAELLDFQGRMSSLVTIEDSNATLARDEIRNLENSLIEQGYRVDGFESPIHPHPLHVGNLNRTHYAALMSVYDGEDYTGRILARATARTVNSSTGTTDLTTYLQLNAQTKTNNGHGQRFLTATWPFVEKIDYRDSRQPPIASDPAAIILKQGSEIIKAGQHTIQDYGFGRHEFRPIHLDL